MTRASGDEVVPVVDSGARIRGLDGLRGAAALVVVVDHCLLATPLLGASDSNSVAARGGSLAWWLTDTPLHLPWAGTEAVYFFFVLSGFVLALPLVNSLQTSWPSYYARRLVRLYLPVWVALLVALAISGVVSRHVVPGSSAFLKGFAVAFGLHNLLHDGVLVRGSSQLDAVLWSLQWEVVFSLALPLYVFLARRGRSLWPVKAAVVLLLVSAGTRYGNEYLHFLPMFGLGTLVAFEHQRLQEWAERFTRRRGGKMLSPALGVVAVLLVTCSWSYVGFRQAGVNPYGWRQGALISLEVLGATLLLVLGLVSPRLRRAAESSPAQWAGQRSYSLYLVHLPIVVAVAYLLGGRPTALVMLAICVPVSLAASDIFYRLVERPSHRLSRWAGRALRQTTASTFVRPQPG